MRLLDLFCCAGGAAMGYHQAGFDEIVGVDIVKQKRYPFTFVQGDAIEYLLSEGHRFDAVHASPPCQGYSKARHLQGREHPDLIDAVRKALVAVGKPYIIENVQGAPLQEPVTLTGTMFGLMVVRPRLFESNILLPQPEVPKVEAKHAKMGRPPKEGEYIHVVGHFSDVEYARKAMGIGWMVKAELAEAIPPAYTRWIGEHLMAYLNGNRTD